jgi:hypothetical protein
MHASVHAFCRNHIMDHMKLRFTGREELTLALIISRLCSYTPFAESRRQTHH